MLNIDKIKLFEHYDCHKKINMNILYYIPEGDINKMPILITIPGCTRCAIDYSKIWSEFAEKEGFIVIVPEFRLDVYSVTDYVLGGVVDGIYDYSGGNIYVPNIEYNEKINNVDKWNFHNIDEIYLEFIKLYHIQDNGYTLYGHSAGSQFVHRGILLNQFKKATKMISVASGNWTNFEYDWMYPYGIKNIHECIDKNCLSKNVYILVGSLDINTDNLDEIPLKYECGNNRLERANYFYKSARSFAMKEKIDFNWKFKVLNNVEHNPAQGAPYIVDIINGNM